MPPRKRSPEDSGRGRKQKRDVAPEAKQPSKKRDVSPEDKPKKRGKKQKIQVGGLRRAGRAMSAERTPREQRQRQRDMSVSPVSVSNPIPPSKPRGRTMERTTATNRVSSRSVDNLVSQFRRLAIESPQQARQLLRPVARKAVRKAD